MAYQRHPNLPAPDGGRRGGGPLAARAAAGLVAGAALAIGGWYLLRGQGEAPPVAAAQVEAGTQGQPAPEMAPPARVSEKRQSETVRAALIASVAGRRPLAAAELAQLSRAELREARADILARRGGGTELNAVAAANLRLIEEAERQR